MVKRQRIQSLILLVISLTLPLILVSQFVSTEVVYSDDGRNRDDCSKTEPKTSFLSSYCAGTDGNNVYLPFMVWPSKNVELVGHMQGIVHSVTVAGNYAYVGDDDGGLHIISISDPAKPSETGFLATPGYIKDVAVSGNHAFVANSGKGLRIVDVSDPADPHEIGSYIIPGYFNGVAVSGNYAYVVGEHIGLRIFDVSDPSKPVEVGAFGTDYNSLQAYDVALAQDYAYSADNGGLRIIDVSDPTEPSETGLAATSRRVSVALEGSFAFTTSLTGGLSIFDVSNPISPTWVGGFDTPGGPLSDSYGIDVAGGFVYLTDWNNGLRIIDVANPEEPSETGYYITPGRAIDVAVTGNLAYVAADYDGLLILRHTQASH